MLDQIIKLYEGKSDRELMHVILLEFHLLNIKIDKVMSNTDDALAGLASINDQLVKIGKESAATLAEVAALEAAAANAATPQSVLDAIAKVKAQAQVVDDLVPDAPAGDGGTGDAPAPPAGDGSAPTT